MSEITRLTGKLTIKFNFHNKKNKAWSVPGLAS